MAILDTGHHGIPHCNRCLYIVAVRLDAEVKPFTFPRPIHNLPALPYFLRGSPHRAFMQITPGGLAKRCSQTAPPGINGCNVMNKWFVLDPLGSNPFNRMLMRGCLPFRSRSGLVDLAPTVDEIGALQGLPAKAVAALLAALDNDGAVVSDAISDSTSINVLMRILPRALFSAGLVAKPLPDYWASASAITAGVSCVVKMPDALYDAIRK